MGSIPLIEQNKNIMLIIGRSKIGLYINNQGVLQLIYLDHSESKIENDFYSLPKFETMCEARKAFPELN